MNIEITFHILRNNSLDILRFALAILVYIAHLINLTGETNWYYLDYSYFAVNCFFVLSGYLMPLSYSSSNSIQTFYIKRLKRIYILYCIVVLTTFIVGVLVAENQNIFSTNTIKYLAANLLTLNFIEPNLNWLFQNNLIKAVNGSLWSIKVELMFYLIVPFLYKFINSDKKYNIYIVFGGSIFISVSCLYIIDNFQNSPINFLNNQLPVKLCYFMSGWLLYHLQTLNKKYEYVLIPISLLLLLINGQKCFTENDFNLIIATFFVLIFSKTPQLINTNWSKKLGAISYPIYLIHFPLIQFTIQILNNKSWSLNLVLINFACLIGLSLLLLEVEKVILSYLNNKK